MDLTKEEIIKEVRTCIAQDRVADAIKTLKSSNLLLTEHFDNRLTLIETRYNTIKIDKDKGVLNYETYDIIFQQVKDAFLHLCGDLENTN
jgi:Effector-associated domain 11